MNRDVRLFDGSVVHVCCDDKDIAETLNRIMIEPFREALSVGWLASGQRAMRAENRIKGYIDYVGTLMIRSPDEHGVLGPNKEKNIKANEWVVGDVDGPSKNLAPAKESKRKKKITRTTFDKLTCISKDPNVDESFWAPVDTFSNVSVFGKTYHVMDKRYDGRKTTGWDGLYYDLDRVYVIKMKSGEVQFRDQNVDDIDVQEKN